jgi:hypothetical protein
MKSIRLLALGAACALAGPVLAESLRVEGPAPAGSDAAAALQVVAIEQFGGEGGADLSFRIEDALRAATYRGQPWLRVVPYGPNDSVQALMRGTVAIEERVTNYTEQRERCIKDAAGKCTDAKEKFQVRCKRRIIELQPRIRLLAPDGALLWSDNQPETYNESWCEDADRTPRPRSAIARELGDRVARRTVNDFVPRDLREDVRVDESRKGLSKADSNLFKAAVRKVKDGNASGACADWANLSASNPAHLPSLFNLGQCAESAGDDAVAEDRYRQVLVLDQNHARAQARLNRIAERKRAKRQIAAHGRS